MSTCGFGGKGWYIKIAIMSLLSCGSSYGYELIERLEGVGIRLDEGSTGTLYKTLRELEKEEYLCSIWKKSHLGPRRRKYSITEKGKEEIRKEVKRLKEIKGFIDEIIKNCKEVNKGVF
ncbi:MAG: hypothetical protein DRP50_00575 [Thermotoga sp.]|nr:MAG: hypothetical protein DRP50_00575 [Thermotoga sp.]